VSTRRRAPGEGGRPGRTRGPRAHGSRLGRGSDASPERPEPPVAAARKRPPRTAGPTRRGLPREPCAGNAGGAGPRPSRRGHAAPAPTSARGQEGLGVSGRRAGSALSPLAAMTSLLTTPSPGEEPMTTPILQATEALSPKAEASTALIAVVITVVFLTLLSVVILIFFYLYKNKGSYVTYEPAEGEPSAILQMESDSAKGREKEEYFI
uniref:Small cell adhesion glycoprotein n=1 Tax=Felis catus TaxID=9685 RepID=A0ABI7ZNG6_FELCA